MTIGAFVGMPFGPFQIGAHSRTHAHKTEGFKKATGRFGNAPDIDLLKYCGLLEDKNSTQFFFLKLFGHLWISQQKSWDIPPKSLVSLGFEGHTELLDPHPFTWKASTPPEDIWSQQFDFVLPFFA